MKSTGARWWNHIFARFGQRARRPQRREAFARPALESLEQRIVPAHDLAIDFVDTFNVAQVDDGWARIFTALADDAVVNVADIQAAFDAGLNVVLSTGEGGGSTGNIVWREGADAFFTGVGEFQQIQSLTLQTDPLDSARNVDIRASLFGSVADLSPFWALNILTGGSGGAVTLRRVDVAGGPLNVTSGDAGIYLNDSVATHGGDMRLTGNVLLKNNVDLSTTADVDYLASGMMYLEGTIDGDGDPRDLQLLVENGFISLDGDLGGVQQKLNNLTITGNLFLNADRTITVQSQFTLAAGMLNLASHDLTVATGTFNVGDGVSGNGSAVLADLATLAGSGTVHADMPMQVASNGIVSPGDVRNLGMIEVFGSIVFQTGSHLVVDLGDTPDNLHVTGSVQLDPGALLFGGSGALAGPGPFAIVTADGGLTGQGAFANTRNPIGLADDLVRVRNTANAVLLERFTFAVTQFAGATPDGMLYSIVLTGGGIARMQAFESFRVGQVLDERVVQEQIAFTYTVSVPFVEKRRSVHISYETVAVDTGTSTVDVTIPVLQEIETDVTVLRMEQRTATRTVFKTVQSGADGFARSLDIRVWGSTAVNQLIIATKANGGFGRLEVGSIIVTGALGALVAPTTVLGSLQVDRYLGRVQLSELRGPLNAGGAPGQRSFIAIKKIDGDITIGSAIAALTSHQVGAHTITAPRIGRLLVTANVAGRLNGDFNARLVLDVGVRSALALGFADIAGSINQARWDIRGSIGEVTVRGAIVSWFVGDPDIELLGNIRSLHVGPVRESSIWANGRIGKLIAASWDGFVIRARTLGVLKVVKTFSASLVLDAGLSTAKALDSAVVGGIAGEWDIRGSLGAVAVRGTVDGWSLGTEWGEHADRLGSIRSLHVGQVVRLDINARGRIGALSAIFAAADPGLMSIRARSIGTLNVKGAFTGNLVLDAGDELAPAIDSARLTSIRDSTWDIRGSLGAVTVDRSATGWILGTGGSLGHIRKLSVGGTIHDSRIHAVGRIGALRAAQWQVTDVTARSLDALSVKGPNGNGMVGAFLFSTVTLTGAAGGIGLGKVDIGGRVYGSTFNVLAGHVTSFTCGRFESSGLYVGYVPADPTNLGALGQFLGAWTLASFTTASMPAVPRQSDPRTDGFQSSQIVASRFGQVILTGVFVRNGGRPFGLRVNGAANAGKVRINTAPFNPGVNVTPGTTAVDFQFLAS